MSVEPRAVAVYVPGSTSNLGPGFDVLGLAIDRGVRARFEPGAERLQVVRPRTLETVAAVDEDLLVGTFMEAGGGVLRGRLEVVSDLPVARGLGSSAASRVAGLLLAGAALGRAPLPPHEVVARVAAAERHPDNAAPAALGGLVATARDPDGGFLCARLPLSPRVGFAFAEPGVAVRTDAARRALPASVPHALAAATAGRLALLLHGLSVADPELVAAGLHDELHVPWRLPLVPGAERARQAALEAGAWGVTLSGSGSGLLALGPPEAAGRLADAMGAGFRAGGAPGGEAFAFRPEPRGAHVLEPSPPA